MPAIRQVIDAVTALRDLTDANYDSGTPSAAQLAALAEFPGWGPVAPLLDPHPPAELRGHAADLRAASDGLNLDPALDVVDTSFYTPPRLAELMWDTLVDAGFDGGRVLDLGCGSGRFRAAAPSGLPIRYTGVDRDPISTRIAELLYPTAQIITGNALRVRNGSGYDAVIGNVPFSASHEYTDVFGRVPLHLAIALYGVRALRPGGYAVLITSRYLLDSSPADAAKLGEFADLVAAIRLPSGSFPGTDTCADVLILRAHDSGDTTNRWHHTDVDLPIAAGDGQPPVTVNRYWGQHPQLVAGTMEGTGFTRSPLRVIARNGRSAAIERAFAAARAALPAATPPESGNDSSTAVAGAGDYQEGSFHLIDGVPHRVTGGRPTPLARPTKELVALIEFRDAAVALYDAEADWDAADAAVEPTRSRCADLYHAYVARFGPLNRGHLVASRAVDPDTGEPKLSWRTPAMGGFRRDPDFVRMRALEVYDPDTGDASPAPMLLRRVNRRPAPVAHANGTDEALGIAMAETCGSQPATVDLSRVATLLGLGSDADALAALGDRVFRDPDLGGAIVAARDYLCGDVRAKLVAAQVAAAGDPDYERNVTALQAVAPDWLQPHEIGIDLGSPLLTKDDVEAFATEVLGASWAQVQYEPLTSKWSVDGSMSAAATAFRTGRLTGLELLKCGLNAKVPVIYDERFDATTGKAQRVRNRAETEAAVVTIGLLADRFSTWVWEDAHRSRRLTSDYNRRFNTFVPRQPDGAHLEFPGLSDAVTLWPWQRDWVDHAATLPAAQNCSEMGLGKSLAAISLMMTLKSRGLVNKPALAVPRHLIEQITAEAVRAYPSARILMVTPDDLAGDARRLFVARCASIDWDAIIMTHEGLTSLPMPPEVETEWVAEELSVARDFLREGGYNSKSTARMVRTLESRLAEARSRANDATALSFTLTGIDHLSIDEVDRYRRLPVHTTSDGFSLGSSTRATDLYLKLWWLRQRNPNRPTFAGYTGTPFVNTFAESYVAFKYSAPQHLTDLGVEHFDAFTAMFIRYETLIEVSPDGSTLRSKRRPAIVANAPELRRALASFMFFKTADQAGIPRPTPVYETVSAPPTAPVRKYMESLVDIAEGFRQNGYNNEKGADNILTLITGGRMAALSGSLVGLKDPETAVTKLVLAADRIARIYHDTRTVTYPGSSRPGAFQLVFCDLGTPKPTDTQVYGQLRNLLIERGVPTNEVRFAHDAASTKAREALFAGCRDGSVAVMLASSSLAGVGANVQQRLCALHHLDVPWCAATWAQRNARAIRFGNHHRDIGDGTVQITTYCTENTFDAFVATAAERKARQFAQLYDGTFTGREISDIGGDDTAITLAEVKVAASGSPLLRQQHDVSTRLRSLHVQRSTTMQTAQLTRERARRLAETANRLRTTSRGLTILTDHISQVRVTETQFGEFMSDSLRRRVLTVPLDDRTVLRLVRKSPTAADFTASVVSHNHGNTVEVHSFALPTKLLTRSSAVRARTAAKVFRAWVRSIPDVLTDLTSRIAELDADADAARQAADSVVFERQDELDQLATELAIINAQIAEEAGDDYTTAA